jgi:K+-transporting ATPase KdpF subunit
MGFIGFVRLVARRWEMNGVELVGLIVSAGLLLYLVIALLKPEWFA